MQQVHYAYMWILLILSPVGHGLLGCMLRVLLYSGNAQQSGGGME